MRSELLPFLIIPGLALGLLASACGEDTAQDQPRGGGGAATGAGGVPSGTDDARRDELAGAGGARDGSLDDPADDASRDLSLDAPSDPADRAILPDVADEDGTDAGIADDVATADRGDALSEDGPEDAPSADVADGRPGGDAGIPPRQWRFVRFAVIGDYGADTPGEARVADLVESWSPDFVITTGDNNYTGAGGDAIDSVIGQYYRRFIGNYIGQYGPGSLTNRFWPSPGNHDWDALNLRAYTDYFTLPGNERYYDAPQGLVHLFAIDSDFREPDGTTESSIQANWLRTQLAASSACFKVVYFHHPPYSSGSHGSSLDMRWPFEAWGADVVVAGHDHDYERLEVGRIPYFTVGLGGAAIYPFVSSLPESRARYNADFGALRVTAYRRGMRFEFMDANGTLVESFTYRKRCP